MAAHAPIARARRSGGERLADQHQGEGEGEAATDALEGPGGYEHARSGARSADGRARREDRQAGEEHPGAPEAVTEGCAGEHHRGEGQRVGGDGPRQRRCAGGNRTWAGARTQGVITSIIATAAKNGIDAVACLAARARDPDPGLAVLLG